jgi:hypothetical protein
VVDAGVGKSERLLDALGGVDLDDHPARVGLESGIG